VARPLEPGTRTVVAVDGFSSTAFKFFRSDVGRWVRRHPEARGLVEEARRELEANPYLGEPLHGRCSGLYKYRKGQLRIIYWLDTGNCLVRVIRIGYRGRIYEELGC